VSSPRHAHLRGHIDDGPATPRVDQLARDGLRHEIGGAHIQRKDEIEIFCLHVDEGCRLIGSGIIDQDVESRLFANRLSHRVNVADVERKMRSLLATRADRLGCLLDFLCCARSKRDIRAGICQRGGGRKANASAGTRHQGALTVEAKGGGGRELNCHASSCLALCRASASPAMHYQRRGWPGQARP
jgi:hypothetical protein